jgi:hypothetical protein
VGIYDEPVGARINAVVEGCLRVCLKVFAIELELGMEVRVMKVVTESVLDGLFTGWDGGNYYRLINGQVWQQVRRMVHYRYVYRPRARVLTDGARHFLEVDGVPKVAEVCRVPDTIYIYDSRGKAVGFWQGKYIHTLDGRPIGQLCGTRVHKLSGDYVGELYKDMVVDKRVGDPGPLRDPGFPAPGLPANAGTPGNPRNRGALNCAYPDVFCKLLE